MNIGVLKKKDWLLRGFSKNYQINNIENLELDHIHSIEFVNS